MPASALSKGESEDGDDRCNDARRDDGMERKGHEEEAPASCSAVSEAKSIWVSGDGVAVSQGPPARDPSRDALLSKSFILVDFTCTTFEYDGYSARKSRPFDNYLGLVGIKVTISYE